MEPRSVVPFNSGGLAAARRRTPPLAPASAAANFPQTAGAVGSRSDGSNPFNRFNIPVNPEIFAKELLSFVEINPKSLSVQK